jgi:hypothetical protein
LIAALREVELLETLVGMGGGYPVEARGDRLERPRQGEVDGRVEPGGVMRAD